MAENKSKLSIVTNGLLKENPTLRLVLGTCPTLAVTTAVSNALGMGAAATVVLICSNFVISALRKVIPDKVHLPCYITIIATFVTLVQMIVKAYAPALDTALGVYLPLIVVNCIILGRAEIAKYRQVGTMADARLDGFGNGDAAAFDHHVNILRWTVHQQIAHVAADDVALHAQFVGHLANELKHRGADLIFEFLGGKMLHIWLSRKVWE